MTPSDGYWHTESGETNKTGPIYRSGPSWTTERRYSPTFRDRVSSKCVLVELLGRYSNLPNLPQILKYNTSHTVPIATPHVHPARRRLSAETVQQLTTDYQAGVPSTQLAQRYGISKGAVLRLLRKQGIPTRRQSMTAAETEQAARLYQAGNSLAAIGAKLGYDHGTVHHALKRAGVAMRDSHGRER